MKSLLSQLLRDYSKELILIFAAIGSLIIAAPTITLAKYSDAIASKQDIVNKKSNGIILVDKSGTQFFSFYDGQFKEYMPLNKISKQVQNAVIVAEDEDFYNHNGVAYHAIIGAAIANFKKGDMVYGGSTITQQLVKNTLMDPKKHIFRKYEEVVMAQEIEERYSKAEILEMYLNTVYFGEGAYGIEEAAQTYFNKHASELNINEASMLAGIIAAPSKLSPVNGDQVMAKERQKYVIDEMFEDGLITSTERNIALQAKLTYSNGRDEKLYKAPHFALLVRDQLLKKYGEKELTSSGMKVYTTLDLNWQLKAEQTVKEQVQKLRANNGTNAGVVVMDPKTGYVHVLVGSADWSNDTFGKVNMATTPRQPGSSFKPIVFLSGFEMQKATPATVLIDSPRSFGNNYRPKNYDEKFRGPVSARYALANSLNVPSVELMTKVGVENSLIMAKRLGINSLKTTSDYGPSLVLGSGEVPLIEMTTAYATFANEGEKHDPVLITKIEDKKGKIIYTHEEYGQQVVDPKYVFLVSSILSDKKTRQDVFGNALDINRTAAVKTGTSENYKDAWTIGYTPNLTIGVWVGNNDNSSMDKVAGSLGAAPIWKDLMEEFSKDKPEESFLPPSGVIAQGVCADGGRRAFRGSNVDTEYFVAGTENVGCRPLDNSKFAFAEIDRFIASLTKKDESKKDVPQADAAQPTTPPSQPPIGGVAPPEYVVPTAPAFTPPQDSPEPGNGNGRGRDKDKDD